MYEAHTATLSNLQVIYNTPPVPFWRSVSFIWVRQKSEIYVSCWSMSNKAKTHPKFHRMADTENEKWKKGGKSEGKKLFETGSQGCGSERERGEVSMKDQHPSREEMAWWRVAGTLTPCSVGVGKRRVRSRVKCFVLSTAINIRTSYTLLPMGLFALFSFYIFLKVLTFFTNLWGFQSNVARYLCQKLPSALPQFRRVT
jgi:hypothetical protein